MFVHTARDMIDLYCNISDDVYNIPGIIPDHIIVISEDFPVYEAFVAQFGVISRTQENPQI